MVTDYDCWKEEASDVDIQMVLQNLCKNAENAKRLLQAAAKRIADFDAGCKCREAAKYAIITAEEARDPETVKKLKVLLPNYF